MQNVLKYPIARGATSIELPSGATFMHFALQRGVPTMWFAVPTDAEEKVTANIHRVMTGGVIDESCHQYVGTWMKDEGYYVEHIFLEWVTDAAD